MMFFWFLPLLLIIPFIVVWATRSADGGPFYNVPPTRGTDPRPYGADPIEIVRARLARGEITPAEYDEIVRALGA